ncbi:unnamed protein product [Commensalibacter communis]|uniref:Uncharacterized protein n=1 Tax=Commensalibacter communis TaxID=2972786 RepID=A0A9W4TPZ9_9PROT|nr:hypothetical protein [Commensalibacter communis]CAI3924512.1 unnamed protein product [Commensalibacter communis]CAI3925020.1 unnamed protein product [Commensalibacter communis]CAI3945643.1 unnamed protein product [Commensalibacter communis]CAI3946714.1 unnamed protein product [Commensalibacter communis]CAI3948273.1 unnamed protein product [Commensalibacter communis]
MKRIKHLLIIALLLFPSVGCQMDRASNSLDEPTLRSVAKNYLFVHGMCMGYLQNPSVTKDQFNALFQLDQQAKLSVIKALNSPNKTNLEQAQYLMKQIIAFLTVNKA